MCLKKIIIYLEVYLLHQFKSLSPCFHTRINIEEYLCVQGRKFYPYSTAGIARRHHIKREESFDKAGIEHHNIISTMQPPETPS
mgnify:CR=1 FL=1